jgi:hypothetical protein
MQGGAREKWCSGGGCAATGPAARASAQWPGLTATRREEQNSGAGAMLAFALLPRV